MTLWSFLRRVEKKFSRDTQSQEKRIVGLYLVRQAGYTRSCGMLLNAKTLKFYVKLHKFKTIRVQNNVDGQNNLGNFSSQTFFSVVHLDPQSKNSATLPRFRNVSFQKVFLKFLQNLQRNRKSFSQKISRRQH